MKSVQAQVNLSPSSFAFASKSAEGEKTTGSNQEIYIISTDIVYVASFSDLKRECGVCVDSWSSGSCFGCAANLKTTQKHPNVFVSQEQL